MIDCNSLKRFEAPRLPKPQTEHIKLIVDYDNSEKTRKNISSKELSKLDKKLGITEHEVSAAKSKTNMDNSIEETIDIKTL